MYSTRKGRKKIMKSCHVCEIFVVNKQMLACLRCKDVYCKRCVDKYFKDFSFEEAMIDAKSAVRLVSKCFLCRHVCKCRRCEQIKRQDHYVEHMVEYNNVIYYMFSDYGLFAGQNCANLPPFMQRIYLLKSMLYTDESIVKKYSEYFAEPSQCEVMEVNNSIENVEPERKEDSIDRRDGMYPTFAVEVNMVEEAKYVKPNVEWSESKSYEEAYMGGQIRYKIRKQRAARSRSVSDDEDNEVRAELEGSSQDVVNNPE